MEGSKEIKIPLEKFLKRSWPVLIFSALLLIVTSVLLFKFAVSGKAGKTELTATTTTSQVENTTTTSQGLIPRALDGVLVTPEEAWLLPYAVMVENHTEARPVSGPAEANLVYEIPVEGGITRFLLVFDATTTVDAIGPVRSARPYYVDFADGLDAVFAHVGGSPEALDMIAKMPEFRDLNEFANGRFFWRSTKRAAPHNVFTRTDLLHEAADGKKYEAGRFTPWSYKDDDPADSATGTVRGTEDGPKLVYGGSYTTNWKYNREKNDYLRYEAGKKQTDQDGIEVRAKNVVVMQTDGSVMDAEGRLKIRTTGRGRAVLYRDGGKQEISWYRAKGEHIKFESIEGKEIVLNRGTTWIEVTLDPTVYSLPGATTTTAQGATTK